MAERSGIWELLSILSTIRFKETRPLVPVAIQAVEQTEAASTWTEHTS